MGQDVLLMCIVMPSPHMWTAAAVHCAALLQSDLGCLSQSLAPAIYGVEVSKSQMAQVMTQHESNTISNIRV